MKKVLFVMMMSYVLCWIAFGGDGNAPNLATLKVASSKLTCTAIMEIPNELIGNDDGDNKFMTRDKKTTVSILCILPRKKINQDYLKNILAVDQSLSTYKSDITEINGSDFYGYYTTVQNEPFMRMSKYETLVLIFWKNHLFIRITIIGNKKSEEELLGKLIKNLESLKLLKNN